MATDKKDDDIPKPNNSNVGKFWTVSEATEVKRLLAEGKSTTKIAQAVGRNEGGIRAKFKQWAIQEITAGDLKDKVLTKYRIDPATFTMNKENADKKSKTNKSELNDMNQKIDTLTNLLNLALKNQKELSDKLDVIIKHCS